MTRAHEPAPGAAQIVEIIHFRPRPGAEAALLAKRAAAVAALSEHFGLIHSTLGRVTDELWVDVMRFPSAEAADDAVAREMGLPAFAEWVANVAEVVARERAAYVGS